MHLPAIRTRQGFMGRLLQPVARVFPQETSHPHQDDSKKYDIQKARNEKLTMWNKFFQYAFGDSVILGGMYKQRLDGDDSNKNPFYNPQGAGKHHLDWDSGFFGFLSSVNLFILTKAGELGQHLLGPENYNNFIHSQEQRVLQNRQGDYLFAAGNGMRLLGGFIFAGLFKGSDGRHKEKEKKLQGLIEWSQKQDPKLTPLLEEYAHSLNCAPSTGELSS